MTKKYLFFIKKMVVFGGKNTKYETDLLFIYKIMLLLLKITVFKDLTVFLVF